MLYAVTDKDNVATALGDMEPGEAQLTGARTGRVILKQSVPFGHKAAVGRIPKGGAVIKYAAVIGVATKDIGVGEWVHIHNCKSLCDPRTGGFDEVDDEPSDMRYTPEEYDDGE